MLADEKSLRCNTNGDRWLKLGEENTLALFCIFKKKKKKKLKWDGNEKDA